MRIIYVVLFVISATLTNAQNDNKDIAKTQIGIYYHHFCGILYVFAANGGNILDPQILAFAFFMFMWQIPHFFSHMFSGRFL